MLQNCPSQALCLPNPFLPAGEMVAVGSRVALSATYTDPVTGERTGPELWRTDGGVAPVSIEHWASALVEDIHPSGGSSPRHLTVSAGNV